MADLIIKPTTGSGNKLIIQTEDGTPIVTTSDSGAALSEAVSGTGSTSASDLVSGTLPDGRFPATLPAASAANLTAVPAANLSGTLPAIDGSALTNLPAANLLGTLPAIDGSALTNLPAANLLGTLPAIDGSALTNLPAGSLGAGHITNVFTFSQTGSNLQNGGGTERVGWTSVSFAAISGRKYIVWVSANFETYNEMNNNNNIRASVVGLYYHTSSVGMGSTSGFGTLIAKHHIGRFLPSSATGAGQDNESCNIAGAFTAGSTATHYAHITTYSSNAYVATRTLANATNPLNFIVYEVMT